MLTVHRCFVLAICWVCSVFAQLGIERDVVLVKIGGSSITEKAQRESVNEAALKWFAHTISQSIDSTFLQPFSNDQCEKSYNFRRNTAFIVVHGAGSFGHFSAKDYGLKGHDIEPLSNTTISSEHRRYELKGLAETRLSVQTLNNLVVKALLNEGVNAVGISPCFGIPGLEVHAKYHEKARIMLLQSVVNTLSAGLVPVLHGDACLYGKTGVGILSGDILMEIIGTNATVDRAIFVTDVDGVFTADPKSDRNAQLLKEIVVDGATGSIKTALQASSSSHEHDVTGGLMTKLNSAAIIAASKKIVTIVKCESESAEKAIRGDTEIDIASVVRSEIY